MPISMFSYTKRILECVSFDAALFGKELQKAFKVLLPYELEQLMDWLQNYIAEKPELRVCLLTVEQ